MDYRILITAVVVLAAAGWFLFGREAGFRWDLFLATFSEIRWGWAAGSIALVLLTYLGRAIRWQVMIRPFCPTSSLRRLFVSTAIGFTAVVFFGRAGELVRPYLIAKKEKVSFSSQLAVWFLERIYDLLSVLVLFGFALTQIRASSGQLSETMTWMLSTGGHLVGFLCTVCLALLVTFGLFPAFVEKRLTSVLQVLPSSLQSRVGGMVRAFLSGTSSTQQAGSVIRLILYTFAEWLLIVACFLCLLKGLPATANMGPIDVFIIVGVVAFGGAVQIPGIGGGMQVATIFVLTELFRVPLETATGTAILMWFVAFVAIIPIGVVLAVREGLHWRELTRQSELEVES